jgi:hypothetical protein
MPSQSDRTSFVPRASHKTDRRRAQEPPIGYDVLARAEMLSRSWILLSSCSWIDGKLHLVYHDT